MNEIVVTGDGTSLETVSETCPPFMRLSVRLTGRQRILTQSGGTPTPDACPALQA